jgi:hypothetical protein
MPPLSRTIALLALLALLGCDRAMEPYVPGEKPEPPDLSKIFPEGAKRAAAQEAPMAAGGGAAGMPGANGGPPGAAAAAPVSGTVQIAPDLQGKAPAGATLFLIVRRAGSTGGPPLAVKRIESPRFPLAFSIGPDDRMIKAMPFAGPLTISARLDADGNAMTRAPGDLQGEAPGLHQPGDSGIALVIDQVL